MFFVVVFIGPVGVGGDGDLLTWMDVDVYVVVCMHSMQCNAMQCNAMQWSDEYGEWINHITSYHYPYLSSVPFSSLQFDFP